MSLMRSLNPSDQAAVDEGCYFDYAAAERVRDFFSKFLKHSKGDFAGKPFELLEWQWNDVIQPLYGWRRRDGTRRFRKAFIYIPKKNGKSTLCAGLALYHLCGDNEYGGEVYSAAADKKQASIVFNEAKNMVKSSPALVKRLQIRATQKEILFPQLNDATYAVLAADAFRQEGYNTSALIFDELHAQKNRLLWDTLKYSGIARKQPMMIAITTAPDKQETLCFEEYKYAKDVLEGTIIDTEQFGYIREALVTDDFTSAEAHKKANPSYGVTIMPEEIMAASKEAEKKPSAKNSFLRYRLNIVASSTSNWITRETWLASGNNSLPKPYPGERCTVGIDLSSTRDIAAVVAYFHERQILLPFFFVPKRTLQERKHNAKMNYDYFVENGTLRVTNTASIHYPTLMQCVVELSKLYNVEEVGMDPWNATQFAQELKDKRMEVVFIRQGPASLSQPMKFLEAAIYDRSITHYGNEILAWMAHNTQQETDKNKNVSPHKKNSADSIDGIVASIMAIFLVLKRERQTSVYKDRGLLTISGDY
jgi:phage terminase large subunit-like protein